MLRLMPHKAALSAINPKRYAKIGDYCRQHPQIVLTFVIPACNALGSELTGHIIRGVS